MASELGGIIERGLRRIKVVTREWQEHRRLWMLKRRNSFIAKGLTSEGKVRKQSYALLIGMTDEQKRQRRLQQQRTAMNRARHKRLVKMSVVC